MMNIYMINYLVEGGGERLVQLAKWQSQSKKYKLSLLEYFMSFWCSMSSSVTGGGLGLHLKSPLSIISLIISASVLCCCSTFSMAFGSLPWVSGTALAVPGFLGGMEFIAGGDALS